MSPSNPELLIDHLDKTLQGESIPEAEALIARDAAAREQWETLQTAHAAIAHTGLYRQVQTVIREMQTEESARPRQGIVRSLRPALRIAAALVLLAGIFVVYKFATVSSEQLYQDHYTSYELRTVRGAEQQSAVRESYRAGNWQAVISAYEAAPAKTAEDHFLAAMAQMERKQFPQAIQTFNALLEHNRRAGETAYRDQADYYLAMAYFANNQPAEGSALIQKIRQDANHPYYEKAGEISGLDLKVLQFK